MSVSPVVRFDGARRGFAAMLVTATSVAIVWSLVVWGDSQPAELPSQWSGAEVVSRLPTWVFAGMAVVISAVASAFAWHAAVRPEHYDRPRRVFLIAGSVGAVTAAAWLISASAVRTSGQEIGAAGLVAVAAVFYGFIPFAFAPSRAQADSTGEPVEIVLEANETLAWSRAQSVPLFAWATAISGLVAIALGYLPMVMTGIVASNLSVAIVASSLAAMFCVCARVRVSVDLRGLRARSATLGIRLMSVRLNEIDKAAVTRLEPSRWAGWGYRVGPRGMALVLRGGPAIVATLHSGAEIAVTTPDADEAVGVLLALKSQELGRAPQ